MNPTGCHDCDLLTGGACPQHSTWTGPTYPAGTIVSPTVQLDTVVEIARLRAENEAQRTGLNNIIIITRVRAEKAEKDAGALRGQIAALREMPDGYGCDDCLAARHDDHDDTMCDSCSAAARKILADTEAAAREHDASVRARAFEEAAKIAQGCGGLLASDAGYLAELNHVGLAKHIAAALREKARKP